MADNPNPQTKISPEDAKALANARSVVEFLESPAYKDVIFPELMAIAQDGYPDPEEYSDNEKLILHYTLKTGETKAIKKVITFLESHRNTVQLIKQKYDNKSKFRV